MSDDEIERLREKRRRELLEREAAGGAVGAEESGSSAAAAAPDEPIPVERAEQLQELANRYDVVLADFYADWCGPCKMLEPVVAELAAETDAAVAKVDVDAHQGLAQQYRVQGVPTLVLFAGGEAVEQVVGVKPKERLAELIERHG
jgi:thioredoxin 1